MNGTEELKQRVKELEAALEEAIEGYEDSSCYKSEYFQKKYPDQERIERLRQVLSGGTPCQA